MYYGGKTLAASVRIVLNKPFAKTGIGFARQSVIWYHHLNMMIAKSGNAIITFESWYYMTDFLASNVWLDERFIKYGPEDFICTRLFI